MAALSDHPLRYPMTNELHARPFPAVASSKCVAYLAIKSESNSGARDREADKHHLVALLDRYGASHPQPGATHYYSELGNYQLRWESHTEFFTYTLIGDLNVAESWDSRLFEVYPQDWLAEAPGSLIASALVRIEPANVQESQWQRMSEWFVPESLAVSEILEGQIVAASDFRIDHSGHSRFVAFVQPNVDERRTGRVVQQLCEIETYKTMAMLGFNHAKTLSPTMREMDSRFMQLTSKVSGALTMPDETLHELLRVSAELEDTVAKSSFRFGATTAYESIVYQRINGLREAQIHGQQTLGDFMSRRFDPAMRTVKSTQDRLLKMAERAQRAADMLRTRVDVQRSSQSQALLKSMNKRAETQLRLQRTVEGLSIVAISYYAVNLVMFLLAPLADRLAVSGTMLKAIATPVVVVCVWVFVHRLRARLMHNDSD
ncbi:MAG: DUF3422 domain-containing protein [Pseudomonadota bacterium]